MTKQFALPAYREAKLTFQHWKTTLVNHFRGFETNFDNLEGVYGSIHSAVDTTVTIANANEWTAVEGIKTIVSEQGIDVQFANEILIKETAFYLLLWSMSFSIPSGSNKEFEGAIVENMDRDSSDAVIAGTGSVIASTRSHRSIGTANDTGNFGGMVIIECQESDTLVLALMNETDSVNGTVSHSHLSVMKINPTSFS